MTFDEYCKAHNITQDEAPAAFAAYLYQESNGFWDGKVEIVPPNETIKTLMDDIDYLRAQIQRVRELHKPYEENHKYIEGISWVACQGCTDLVGEETEYYNDYVEYPCPTIKALNGEQ